MSMATMSMQEVDSQQEQQELERGVRMIQHAFKARNDSLVREFQALDKAVMDSKATLTDWQNKRDRLENELIESQNRTKKLSHENQELMKTEQHLAAQVNRLEKLKQMVLTSVQDDKTTELKQNEQAGALLALDDQYLQTSAQSGQGFQPGYQPGMSMGQGFGAAPMQAQPAYTAPPVSYAAPPVSYAAPPQAPAPLQTPAPAAPAGGLGAGGIDGKQFFRQARAKLSYESFNLFLASIKRLNNQQQTREETLEEARRIFGVDLEDLYKDFELLLNRHGV